jgi:sugar (pentulose or hexulose) kinase
MYFIAVDLGSSYLKFALLNLDNGEIVEKTKTSPPHKNLHDNERIFEIDGDILFRTVKERIDYYCCHYAGIEGILFSTQMHGCVLEDKISGHTVYISWQDTRCLCMRPGFANSYLEHLAEVFPLDTMRGTGVEIKPALALCNLFALKSEKGLCFDEGCWELYTLGSWFIYRLTGQNICHITNAAPTGMADVVKNTWRCDIIEKAGFSEIKFPKIVDDLKVCGVYRNGSVSIPVYPDVGDQQVSVLGSGATTGDVVANIGTAGQVILINPDFSPGSYEIRPYFEGLYNYVISRMPAGRNFDVPVEFIREIGRTVFDKSVSKEYVWSQLGGALTLQDTQGFEADISFYETPEKLASGNFAYINHYNFTLNNLFSSLLHDLARIYARQISILTTGRTISNRLYFCGGMTHNHPIVMEAVEKETSLKAIPSRSSDEVLDGMFRLALVCTERCKDLEETRGRLML